MERVATNMPLAIAAISGALMLSGCGWNGQDVSDNTYPLNADQPVYPTEAAANARENECTTLSQATELRPASVRDMGGWLVLRIIKSDISAQLTDPAACTGDSVYTTFK